MHWYQTWGEHVKWDNNIQGIWAMYSWELTEDEEKNEEIDENVKEFLRKARTIDDFKVGLSVPGKLLPKQIKGGIVLKDTPFVMRRKW